MRISSGGSQDINQLQSDAAQYRNRDFVVDAALAFWTALTQAKVAAEFPHCQIYNAAGSGVVVIIDGIEVSSDTDNILSIVRSATELADGASGWSNKKSGGADGTAHARTESINAVQGTILRRNLVLANNVWTVEFDYPVLLPEGNGLGCVGGIANTLLYGSFWGREV